MLCATAVPQPAHQCCVTASHLHTVDAEIEIVGPAALWVRALRHHQRPSDQRRWLPRPASLDWQTRQIDLVALQHHLLARRGARAARFHRHHGFQEGQHAYRLAPPTRRFRLAQKSKGLPYLAQLLRQAVHAPGDPLHRAEQVDQHRHFIARTILVHDILEQHRGSVFGQKPRLNLRHLQHRRNRRGNPHQPIFRFQAGDEVSQRSVRHSTATLMIGQ